MRIRVGGIYILRGVVVKLDSDDMYVEVMDHPDPDTGTAIVKFAVQIRVPVTALHEV
jgi:hypothetical protein